MPVRMYGVRAGNLYLVIFMVTLFVNCPGRLCLIYSLLGFRMYKDRPLRIG